MCHPSSNHVTWWLRNCMSEVCHCKFTCHSAALAYRHIDGVRSSHQLTGEGGQSHGAYVTVATSTSVVYEHSTQHAAHAGAAVM